MTASLWSNSVRAEDNMYNSIIIITVIDTAALNIDIFSEHIKNSGSGLRWTRSGSDPSENKKKFTDTKFPPNFKIIRN